MTIGEKVEIIYKAIVLLLLVLISVILWEMNIQYEERGNHIQELSEHTNSIAEQLEIDLNY